MKDDDDLPSVRVRFTGVVELPFADDRGSHDIWLLYAIEDAIKKGPESDDIYDSLNLQWEIIDES